MARQTPMQFLFRFPAFSGLADGWQMSFDYLGLLDNLSVHGLQCLDLKVQKVFDSLDIRGASFHRITNVLQHITNPGLCILELVLHDLVVEIWQVRDRADGIQNSIISNVGIFWSKGSDRGDALLATKRLQGLVIYVSALQNNGTALASCQTWNTFDEHPSYLGWTANFPDLSCACPQGSLSSNHVGGITHHQDTDKRITIPMPSDDSIIIIVCALGQLTLISRHRKVDVGDLVVYDRNKFNASDLGDNG